VPVEDEVVRRAQFSSGAFAIEDARLTRSQINAFDTPAVVGDRTGRSGVSPALAPEIAAIVADVESAIRTEGRSVRTSSGAGYVPNRTIWTDAFDRAGVQFHQQNRGVRQRDRPFRKFQPGGHDSHSRVLLLDRPGVQTTYAGC
jgi:hypothetical protein